MITAARPDALVPEAIRVDGRPLQVERVSGVDLVPAALARAAELLGGSGTAGVVLHPDRPRPAAPPPGVSCYAPEDLQGLEMDVIVVVEPAELWRDDEAAAPSLYVTLTRATQAVVVLHSRELPACALPLTRHLAVAVS